MRVITLLLAVACGPPYQEPVAFKVTPGKPDARLTVEADPEKAVIQVYSDSGIGSAEVEVTTGPVPKASCCASTCAGWRNCVLPTAILP